MAKLSKKEKRRKKEEEKRAKEERKARAKAIAAADDSGILLTALIALLVLVGIWNLTMIGVIGVSYVRSEQENALRMSKTETLQPSTITPSSAGVQSVNGGAGNVSYQGVTASPELSNGQDSLDVAPGQNASQTPEAGSSDAPQASVASDVEPSQDAPSENTSPTARQPEEDQSQTEPNQPAENNGGGSMDGNGGNASLPAVPSQNEPAPPVAGQPNASGNSSDWNSSGGNWGEESTTNEITGDLSQTAYWTSGGKSYHFSEDCPSLSRSKNVITGTLQDALSAGKTDPCNNCAGGS